MKFGQRLGVVGFFLAWPAFYFYLRGSERTRIIVSWQGQILVLKNWLSDGRWSIPGGGLHKGESVVIGATRELFEETGIHVSHTALQRLGSGSYHQYGLWYPFQAFLVQLNTEPILRRQHIEVSELCWHDPQELDITSTGPDVLDCLKLLSLKPHDGL